MEMDIVRILNARRIPYDILLEIFSYIELISSMIGSRADVFFFGYFSRDRKKIIRRVFRSVHINENEYSRWRMKIPWKAIENLRIWNSSEMEFPISLSPSHSCVRSFEVNCRHFNDEMLRQLFHFCRWTLHRLSIYQSDEISYSALRKYIPLMTKLRTLEVVDVKKVKAAPHGLDFSFIFLSRNFRKLNLDLVPEGSYGMRKMRRLNYLRLVESACNDDFFSNIRLIGNTVTQLLLEDTAISGNFSPIFCEFEFLRVLSLSGSRFTEIKEAEEQFDSLLPNDSIETFDFSRIDQITNFCFIENMKRLSSLKISSCPHFTFSEFQRVTKTLRRLRVVDIKNNGKVLIRVTPSEYKFKVITGAYNFNYENI